MDNIKTSTDIIILNTSDIQKIYGLTRDEVYAILNVRGCPRIKGGNNKHYRVIKDEFEKFLRARRA